MKIVSLSSIVVAFCACAPSTEITLNTAAINANTAAIDRLIADLEARQQQPAPATSSQRPPHVVCRAGKLIALADGAKPEPRDIDLGELAACKDPADGACLRGMPVSVAEGRCAAGKL